MTDPEARWDEGQYDSDEHFLDLGEAVEEDGPDIQSEGPPPSAEQAPPAPSAYRIRLFGTNTISVSRGRLWFGA